MEKRYVISNMLDHLPDKAIKEAYTLDFGTNGFRMQLKFNSSILKELAPKKVENSSEGYLEFEYIIEDNNDEYVLKVTMT